MAKKKGQTGDEDTDAILGEMEEEGEATPFGAAATDEEADTEEESAEDEAEGEDDDTDEDDDDESADDEGKSKGKKKKPAEESAEDDEEGEDDDEAEDDEDDESGEDEDEEESSDEGEGKKKPLWKRYQGKKQELKAANKLISELQGKQSGEAMQAKITEFAKKHKLNAGVAKGLVELAAEMAAERGGLDKTTRDQLAEVLKQGQQTKFWAGQDKEFDRDFSKNIAPLAQRDKADTKALKKQLYSIAFKPENAKKSLVELYLSLGKTGKKKVTSESGRTAGRSLDGVDLDDLAAVAGLDDEAFDKASEALGKRSKTRIHRS